MSLIKFDRYVDRHARAFTERLQNLCRMPSVAARGTGMRAIAETVEQSMQRVGIGTRSFRMGSGYPIIYGECGGGPKTFGIYTGHTEAGAKTILPSTAMARLDFRLVPDLSSEIVIRLLRDHLDVRGFRDIEIMELGSAPLAKSSAKSRVAR